MYLEYFALLILPRLKLYIDLQPKLKEVIFFINLFRLQYNLYFPAREMHIMLKKITFYNLT
jgi:hypothetical protein